MNEKMSKKILLDLQNSMEDEEKEIPQCQNPIGGIPTLLTSSKNASIFHLTEQSKTKCRFFFFRIPLLATLNVIIFC